MENFHDCGFNYMRCLRNDKKEQKMQEYIQLIPQKC